MSKMYKKEPSYQMISTQLYNMYSKSFIYW